MQPKAWQSKLGRNSGYSTDTGNSKRLHAKINDLMENILQVIGKKNGGCVGGEEREEETVVCVCVCRGITPVWLTSTI